MWWHYVAMGTVDFQPAEIFVQHGVWWHQPEQTNFALAYILFLKGILSSTAIKSRDYFYRCTM